MCAEVTLHPATGTKVKTVDIVKSGFDCGPCKSHTLFIDINQFQNKSNLISINANVRNPGKTSATKAMLETLANDEKRDRMWAYNGGITIIAKKTSKKATGFTLTIPKDYGILNGGHTQQSIHESIKKKSGAGPLVRIEVLEGEFTNAEIAEISRARNTTQNVKLVSVLSKSGILDSFINGVKKSYGDKIEWKENDKPNEITLAGEKLVHCCYLMDGKQFADELPPIYTSTSKLLEQFSNNSKKLKYLSKIADEVIEFRDAIISSVYLKCKDDGTNGATIGGVDKLLINGKNVFSKATGKNKYTIFTEDECKYRVPDSVTYQIMAAFRHLLVVKPKNKEVYWKKRPTELWKEKALREKLWIHLNTAIKQAQSHNNLKKNSLLTTTLTGVVDGYSSTKSGHLKQTATVSFL